jgi:hypothetical protein
MSQISTSEIIKNIQERVAKTNKEASEKAKIRRAFERYEIFIRCRELAMQRNERMYIRAFSDIMFCDTVMEILRIFQMDERGSRLVTRNKFQNTLIETGTDFDLLSSSRIVLENLNLKQAVGEGTVNSVIKNIFETFIEEGNLSESGGIVVASKTMHFIMPELFIMVDNRIMEKLHLVQDYVPSQNETWNEVLPDYKWEKLNLYQGTQNWSYHLNYAAALLYYKRIIREWCQKNHGNAKDFSKIDTRPNSEPSRVIDKALW